MNYVDSLVNGFGQVRTMYAVLLIIAVLIICILVVGLYQKSTNAMCLSRKRMEGRTVLVTGGTAGMGLEIAKDLACRGARVIVGCPFNEEGNDAVKEIISETENEEVFFYNLDLASLNSIRKFARDILARESRLDVLINNAGVGIPCDSVTEDGMQFIMQVNYYGTFLLTLLLLPLLIKTGRPEEASRIIMTSSVTHQMGQMDFGNMNRPNYWYKLRLYANSKLCLVMFANELAERLKNLKVSNVVVNSIDPGAVGTRIFESDNKLIGFVLKKLITVLFKTTWEGAQTALHVALDKRAGAVSGRFFKNCQINKAIALANCNKTCKVLWEESMRLVNLNTDELEQCFISL